MVVAWFAIIIILLADAAAPCVQRRKIYASLIWYHSHKGLTPDEMRIHNYVRNFTNQIFADVQAEDRPEIKIMPPVYAPACVGEEADGNPPDKGRGSNIAHREVWFQFHRYRRPCGEEMGDRLIVFEYDAFIGLPNTGKLVIDSVKKLTTDVHYLGYCYKNAHYDPKVTKKAPYCLHAYVLSLSAAKLLLDDMDACGAFADVQVANLCNNKNVTWSFEMTDYDHQFLNDYFIRDGIHIGGPFLKGGIVVQAKFDKYLNADLFEGQTVQLGRAIYVLVNQTWRYIPNMDTLDSLALDKSKRKPVPVTPWQMQQFSMGPPYPPVR